MTVHARRGVRLLLVIMSISLLAACTRPDPERDTRAAPRPEVLAAGIERFGEVIAGFEDLRAVVVATEDDIVFERYYETDENEYWGMQSITKSVVSTLVGIALEEGLIESLDATLADLLPRHYAAVMSPRTARITLRHLLTMTAGFPSGEEALGPDFTRSRDWVRHILTHPELPPGERFLYSNPSSHLLSAILSDATGGPALAYARTRLFDPLDIDTRPALTHLPGSLQPREALMLHDGADFAWPTDPQGVSTGWWGIRLRPRDMVKIGQLFLSGGRWHGQQVVPADWVEAATSEQVAAAPLDGYGYQWWTDTIDGARSFQALGYGGEQIIVVPDRDLVVAVATEVRQADATSQGIDNQLITVMVEDVIVSRFPPQ